MTKSAIETYFEHMGPTCDHHSDECPSDCPRVAQKAEAEYRNLVERLAFAEAVCEWRIAQFGQGPRYESSAHGYQTAISGETIALDLWKKKRGIA